MGKLISLFDMRLGLCFTVDAVRSGDLSTEPRERREFSETVFGDLTDFLKNDGVLIFLVSITIYSCAFCD